MGIRGFFLRIVAIAAPVFLVFTLVAVVDPFDYFGWSSAVSDGTKLKGLYHDGATMPFNNMLWNILRFGQHPVDHVLLGDSRLSHFDMAHLRAVSGHTYFNLGIPGGDYRSITDLFAFADSVTTLKYVAIQVSFRGMNKSLDWDLYTKPRLLLDKPFLYLTNRRVLKATVLDLEGTLSPSSVVYDKLPPDQWQRVLDMEQENASTFQLDTSNYLRLQHIADRCKAVGARLLFVEFPTHPEVERIYVKAGLEPLRARYIARLSSIAPTIDLDRPGLFPDDRAEWRDPLHLTTKAQRLLTDMVWGPTGMGHGDRPQNLNPKRLFHE